MRYNEIMREKPVLESWIGVTHTGGDILKNPSRPDLFKLIRVSHYDEVRAFLSKNLYVWNSEVLHHDFDMALLAPEDASCALSKNTPERQCVNLHIGLNGPYMAAANIDFEDDDITPKPEWYRIKGFVENHPIMRRLFGTFDLKIEDT